MKPGTISSVPPATTSAPSTTCPAGGFPWAIATVILRHTAAPCERNAQTPSGTPASSSTIVSSAPIASPTLMITNSSDSGQRISTNSIARQATQRADALGKGGRGPVEPHARQPVQPDELDQRSDLWLWAMEEDRSPVRTQPAREHRQVEHQRRIGKRQLAQIDDHIGLGPNRARQRLAPPALRRPI